MQGSDLVIVLVAFVAYLLFMIGIGAFYMRRTTSAEDYFLGGRGLNGWVAALSAQASDMSGWLLMGLPGAVYAFGTGQSWIAIGLFIGTVLNWIFVSAPLRRYTFVANNSLTLPEFFENRFHDKKRTLLLISSVVIVIFFLVYTASAFAAGGKLFNTVFGVDYHVALVIGAIVILAYTFMGGFKAVCSTDFIQGSLMLIGLLLVPILAYAAVSGNISSIIDQSDVAGDSASFLNIMDNGGAPYKFIDIISQLAWGLGYFGMPHILVRFMAIRDEKEIKKSRVIAIVWVALSLFMACFIGVIGRAYLFPEVLGDSGLHSSENVFIVMIMKVLNEQYHLPFFCGIFLCGILAAIMSTADSQLLVTASSISEDIYHGAINRDADEKKVLSISRYSVIIVALLAFIIAWNPNSSIMGLVSNAWSGFGSAFGPLVLMSLFWKRTTKEGAIAGIVSGAAAVIIWDYIPLVSGQTLGSATGLYSLVIGFALSLIMIIVVSLLTPMPSAEIMKEFEQAKQKQN